MWERRVGTRPDDGLERGLGTRLGHLQSDLARDLQLTATCGQRGQSVQHHLVSDLRGSLEPGQLSWRLPGSHRPDRRRGVQRGSLRRRDCLEALP